MAISTRRSLLAAASGAALTGACASFFSPTADTGSNSRREILAAMKRATRFMLENVAYRGGYVWAYLPDMSRRWGEMEAFPSMIWMQPPGTATVGHLYLDCYEATRDDFYYRAALNVADGLIAAQHRSGGWNYMYDFAGEDSTRRWYDTIGKAGWRLEEFHHYDDNATFDDEGTSEASQFLLRAYLVRRDQRLWAPLQRAIQFVLDSQYANGGWPQRFPRAEGEAHYAPYITFNDAVADANILFLLMVYHTLGDERALAAIRRAMEIFPATQGRGSQPAWSLQHHHETLAPIGARSYEPDSFATHTTAGNIAQMMDFYEWTGERRFIERLPEALDWLDSLRLADADVRVAGRHYPTFIEFETNRARINHRRGSNSRSGEYYWDYNTDNPITHYSQWRAINAAALRERLNRLSAASPDLSQSPLARGNFRMPRFFTTETIDVSDMNSNVGSGEIERPNAERVAELLATLNAEGYWPTPLAATSNPYIGEPPAAASPGDFSGTLVGDRWDTSPFITQNPVTGISTGAFIQNMSALLLAVDSAQ